MESIKHDEATYTVEPWFLEPPMEMKIGSKNREFPNIGGKITVKRIQNDFWFEL